MKRALVIIMTLIVTAGGQTTQARRRPQTITPSPPDQKTTSTAMMYSTMSTLAAGGAGALLFWHGDRRTGGINGEMIAGYTLATVGLAFGPGLGHVYARRPSPFSGAGIRLMGTTVVGLGLVMAKGSGSARDKSSGLDIRLDWQKVGYILAAAGGALTIGSTIHTMLSLDDSVREYNRVGGFSAVRVAPCYFAEQDALGLRLTIALD